MSDFDDEDFIDTDVDSDAGSDMKFDCIKYREIRKPPIRP